MEKQKNVSGGSQPNSTTLWIGILVVAVALWLLSYTSILTVLMVLMLIVIVGLLVLGPVLGLSGKPEIKHKKFSEPLGNATSAHIILEPAVAQARVSALSGGSGNLLEADLTYVGTIEFNVGGEHDKMVQLRQSSRGITLATANPFNWINNRTPLIWEVNLNPDVPTELEIKGGVANSRLDLSGLQLTELKVNSGAGSLDLDLPVSNGRYHAVIGGGAGEAKIKIPGGASLDTEIQGGVGEIKMLVDEGAFVNARVKAGVGAVTITVPPDAPVRVRADVGVGSLNLPSHFKRMDGEDRLVGKSGTWETANFEAGGPQIIIDYSGGIGGLTVR
jgi:hypothetical protein